jgi:hypothetical protein
MFFENVSLIFIYIEYIYYFYLWHLCDKLSFFMQ